MEILDRLRSMVAKSEQFTMLEFGACDGYHTTQFLQILLATGRPFALHSFEPELRNFATCQRTLQLIPGTIHSWQRFQLWPLAIGGEEGDQPFYVSGGYKRDGLGNVVDHYYGSSSLRAPKLVTEAWPDMTFVPSTVRVTTLDAFAKAHIFWKSQGLRAVDFIWADIQGAVGDLIRGGAATWERVRYLYTEYDNSELYDGEVIGLPALQALLPAFELVEDYGGDALLRNRAFTE